MKKILIILIILLVISGVAFFIISSLEKETTLGLDQSYCEAHDEARIETINKIVDNWSDIEETIPKYLRFGATGESNTIPVRYQFIGNNKVIIAFGNYDGEDIVPLVSLIGFDCEDEEASNFVFFKNETRNFPPHYERWERMVSDYGAKEREFNNYIQSEEVETHKEWVAVEENLFIEE